MSQLSDNLKANKLKVTPQRLAIYSYLMNSKSHPTVETIYNDLRNDFPAMSLATVYKTVASLRDVHLIKEFNVSEDSNRYDADTSPHSHFICTKCHNVTDYFGNIDLKENIDDLESLSGYEVETYDINFYGLCNKCKS